jgi:3-oxoadipate enol-lactonase / 4-carboxymuconolactone decarboxylase
VLVGVSVGGLTALDFARRHPERVLGAVLCDTGLKIGTPESWATRITAIQAGGLEALADSVMERWFTPGFLKAEKTLVRGYRNMLTRTTPAGYLGTCAALRDADLSRSGPLSVPTLVLCGDHDVSTPPALSESLAAELQAPLHLIGDAGHLPCAEQPEAVIRELKAFLEALEPNGADLEAHPTSPLPSAPATEPPSEPSRYERGLRVRRAVLGDAHVDRALLRASDLDRDFQEFITEYAWGGPWSRGHLDTRTRHLVTLAVLAALPREHELAMHLRATVNTGVSTEDLRELFMHVAVYAGVPVANRAYALAREMLAERGQP